MSYTGSPRYSQLSHRLLQDLCKTNKSMIIYSIEYQRFIGCFCYTMIFACDVFFFIMIDWRTKSFLKIVAFTVFAFSASITTMAFVILSIPNNNLALIIPIISRTLFKNHLNLNFHLKLMNLHNQITVDQMIGVSCAGVYTITNLSNLRTLIAFCLNVILILNLFQSYFLN